MKAKAKRAPGRPRSANSKSSNPGYSQRSVWLPDAMYARVVRKLIDDTGKRREFSGLVEHLLTRWLADGGKLPK
jgi:hypothetical protein